MFRHRGVLLTTYGMVLHNSEALAESEDHDPDDGPLWDVMILDEVRCSSFLCNAASAPTTASAAARGARKGWAGPNEPFAW